MYPPLLEKTLYVVFGQLVPVYTTSILLNVLSVVNDVSDVGEPLKFT